MDFILLYIVSRWNKTNIRLRRLIASSVVGALLSCMLLMMESQSPVIAGICGYILTPVLMCLIVFGRECIRKLVLSVLQLYGVAIMFGGLINCIFYNLSLGTYARRIFGISSKYSISLFMLMAVVGGILLIVPFVIRYYMQYHNRESHLYAVTLSLEGKQVDAKGLLDTGNHLREPMSNRPALIVERTALEQIMDKGLLEYVTRVKVIPYRSIGKEHGTMYALVIDEIKVKVDGQIHIHKNVVACIYEGTLSSKKDYQLILHEELL